MSLPKQYHDENTRHRRKATDPSHWASVAHIFVTTIDVTVWRTKVILTDGIEYFVAEAFRSTGFSKLLNSFIVGLVMSLVADRVTLGARQGRWLGVTVFPRFCAWTFVAIQTKNYNKNEYMEEIFNKLQYTYASKEIIIPKHAHILLSSIRVQNEGRNPLPPPQPKRHGFSCKKVGTRVEDAQLKKTTLCVTWASFDA